MQANDIIVVAFVKIHAVGTRFKEWPLHITVLSWLRGTLSGDQFARKLAQSLQNLPPFKVEVGEEAGFGPAGSILVSLIKEPSLLEQIFEKASKASQAADFVQVSERYPAYRPHITVQSSDRLHQGDTVIVDRLYIVRQYADYKQVEAVIAL